MLNEYSPSTPLLVRPVESAGDVFGLPECDVIGVLPVDGCAIERAGGVLAMPMDDDRLRPLVSLRQALGRPSSAAERFVVVLWVGAQLYGLLVDRAFEPTNSTIYPDVRSALAFATCIHIVRLADGRDVPVLNPVSLAFTAQRPEPTRELRLAA